MEFIYNNIDPELISAAVDEGFDAVEAVNGLFMATDNVLELKKDTIFLDPKDTISHIEKIDVMDVFPSDEAAARDAEQHCKVAIIRDIPEIRQIYIDSPQTRKIITKALKAYHKGEKK